MILNVVRHPPVNVPNGLCYGKMDVPLQPGWQDSADRLAQQYRHLFDDFQDSNRKIYSSPSLRCAEPAAYLADALGLSLVQDDRLRELDFGAWEGWTYKELWEKEPAYRHWMEYWQTEQTPSGDSLPKMILRVNSFISSIQKTSALLCTHAGVIRIARALSRKTEVHKAMSVPVPFFELITIDSEL